MERGYKQLEAVASDRTFFVLPTAGVSLRREHGRIYLLLFIRPHSIPLPQENSLPPAIHFSNCSQEYPRCTVPWLKTLTLMKCNLRERFRECWMTFYEICFRYALRAHPIHYLRFDSGLHLGGERSTTTLHLGDYLVHVQ